MNIGGYENLLPLKVELLENVVLVNQDAFSFELEEIGVIKDEVVPPYTIRTVDHSAMWQKPFPLPKSMAGEVQQLIVRQLQVGLVEPGHGPYSIKWFCVRKSNGGLRLIHDMQAINSITIRDGCIPPNVDEIVDRASGNVVFCLLDAHSGYDQRNLDPKCRDLTGFITTYGLLRKTRSPQGGTNSVADFQRSMVKVLQEPLSKDCLSIYVDDVSVYPDRDSKYEIAGIRSEVLSLAMNLDMTLSAAIRAGLTFSGQKAHIGVPEANIVGHRVNGSGRTPSTKHIESILNWKRFETKTDVRGFVQLAGFFRMYVRGFAAIAEPLFLLLRKRVEFRWEKEQIQAVETLKEILTRYPVLRPIDYESLEIRPLILNTDAGPEAGGGYLGQDDSNGRRFVNRYMSFTFPQTVRNYGQFKRELYAMVKNIKLVQYRIYGCPLVIETDCLPLIGFLNNPDLIDPAMVRWIAYIKLFNPEFRHVKGKDNVVSDGLSRMKVEEVDHDKEDMLEDLGFNFSLAKDEYEGEWLDLVLYLSTLERPRATMTDAEFDKLRKWSYAFIVREGVLFRKAKKGRVPRRVIVIDTDKKMILESLHDEFGHRGVVGTYAIIHERYYWVGLYDDVKSYCLSCHECQARSTKKVQEPLRPWLPKTMDSIWFVDVVAMPEEKNGYKYVILAREGLTGWVEGARLKRKRAKDWIAFIDREIITRYGCTTIVSDHGELDSKEMQTYCDQRGAKFLPVAEYNPRANIVERGHKPFTDGLAKASMKTGVGWSNPFLFNSALWSDRITVKRTTGFSPYYLRHGQDCVLPIETVIGTWPIIQVTNSDIQMNTDEPLSLRMLQLMKHRMDMELGYERMLDMKKKNFEYFEMVSKERKKGSITGW